MFKSDFHSVAQFSQVIGKACVLFLREYLKYLPKVSLCEWVCAYYSKDDELIFLQGYSEDDVYVCESRYAHKSKSFKKIKVHVYNYPLTVTFDVLLSTSLFSFLQENIIPPTPSFPLPPPPSIDLSLFIIFVP